MKNKKLDDDEDRRNPQYIPKKGTFYEHDDRTTLDEMWVLVLIVNKDEISLIILMKCRKSDWNNVEIWNKVCYVSVIG